LVNFEKLHADEIQGVLPSENSRLTHLMISTSLQPISDPQIVSKAFYAHSKSLLVTHSYSNRIPTFCDPFPLFFHLYFDGSTLILDLGTLAVIPTDPLQIPWKSINFPISLHPYPSLAVPCRSDSSS
jgi:hypothetical protein